MGRFVITRERVVITTERFVITRERFVSTTRRFVITREGVSTTEGSWIQQKGCAYEGRFAIIWES